MKKTLRQRVHLWLTARGRTQDWLAARVGVSPPYLTQIIAGQRTPSLPVAVDLENVTGIPAREFLPRRAA